MVNDNINNKIEMLNVLQKIGEPAHIQKYDNFFHNGIITKVDEVNKYIIINDFTSGAEMVLFNNIKRVDWYKKKQEAEVL